MFNLLVTGLPFVPPRSRCTLGSDRVLGHTDKDIEAKYMPGGVLDQQAVMALPTIFTNETSRDPASPTIARVGTITKIGSPRTTRSSAPSIPTSRRSPTLCSNLSRPSWISGCSRGPSTNSRLRRHAKIT